MDNRLQPIQVIHRVITNKQLCEDHLLAKFWQREVHPIQSVSTLPPPTQGKLHSTPTISRQLVVAHLAQILK